jgi:DNA repair exonuclease SbcCD ATPase subunit
VVETAEYVAQCQELQRRYDEQLPLLSKLEGAKNQLTVAVNNGNNLKASLDSVNVQLEASMALVQREKQIIEDAEKAQKIVDRINALNIENITLQTIIREKQTHLNSLNELVKQIKTRENQKKLQQYIDLLGEVRSLTHRNNIPAVINRRFLNQLMAQINGYLSEFEAPFKVTVGENLGFQAMMGSGAAVPAIALSGGQKSMLAMSFWLSVFQVNASKIGLLVIDEGADGLDAANRKIFNEVLAKVDSVFRKNGQQCLIVTHDASIMDMFYTVSV